MTFWAFAADHPVLALLFAGLAFSLPVTLVALFVSWRVSRPVKFTAEDRRALTSAAALLRCFARHYSTEQIGHIDRLEAATKLERMASR
jgi:hypothetical protein